MIAIRKDTVTLMLLFRMPTTRLGHAVRKRLQWCRSLLLAHQAAVLVPHELQGWWYVPGQAIEATADTLHAVQRRIETIQAVDTGLEWYWIRVALDEDALRCSAEGRGLLDQQDPQARLTALHQRGALGARRALRQEGLAQATRLQARLTALHQGHGRMRPTTATSVGAWCERFQRLRDITDDAALRHVTRWLYTLVTEAPVSFLRRDAALLARQLQDCAAICAEAQALADESAASYTAARAAGVVVRPRPAVEVL